jgi:hypothetical protein
MSLNFSGGRDLYMASFLAYLRSTSSIPPVYGVCVHYFYPSVLSELLWWV